MAGQPIPVAVKPVEEAKEKGLREKRLVARVSRTFGELQLGLRPPSAVSAERCVP